MQLTRIFRHVFAEGSARRRFPDQVLNSIAAVIGEGERRHRGQVCFAIESGMPLNQLLRGRSARLRAQEVFSRMRVWDTEHNNGVLIFVLLGDRAVEVVADRGIASRVAQVTWDAICADMLKRFANGDYEQGAREGVAAISAVLAEHFPRGDDVRGNELPDRPVIL